MLPRSRANICSGVVLDSRDSTLHACPTGPLVLAEKLNSSLHLHTLDCLRQSAACQPRHLHPLRLDQPTSTLPCKHHLFTLSQRTQSASLPPHIHPKKRHVHLGSRRRRAHALAPQLSPRSFFFPTRRPRTQASALLGSAVTCGAAACAIGFLLRGLVCVVVRGAIGRSPCAVA